MDKQAIFSTGFDSIVLTVIVQSCTTNRLRCRMNPLSRHHSEFRRRARLRGEASQNPLFTTSPVTKQKPANLAGCPFGEESSRHGPTTHFFHVHNPFTPTVPPSSMPECGKITCDCPMTHSIGCTYPSPRDVTDVDFHCVEASLFSLIASHS